MLKDRPVSPEAAAALASPHDAEELDRLSRYHRAVVVVECGHAVRLIDRSIDGVDATYDAANKYAAAGMPREIEIVARPHIDLIYDVVLSRGCEVCLLVPLRRKTGDRLPGRAS